MQNKYKYPLASDTIDTKDIKKLTSWLETMPQFTMGEMTKKFEPDL